jgi:hypothetical protein
MVSKSGFLDTSGTPHFISSEWALGLIIDMTKDYGTKRGSITLFSKETW